MLSPHYDALPLQLDAPVCNTTADADSFLSMHPAYAGTGVIDLLRDREFRRLDDQGHVYLDYTGGCLYPESLPARHLALLQDSVFGNPHSKNLTSLAMTERVEHARAAVLRYFNADPAEYAVIFTANATGALRLIAEAYPFAPGGRYLLTFDNHNSVNGIRETARAKGASVTYILEAAAELRVDPRAVTRELGRRHSGAHNLFAYPAQSNFTGVQHPLEWIDEAHDAGWDVLLDAAAFAPANRLDLRIVQPDFVDLSFYKMFGYPTGVGALIVRQSALAKLQRPWYSGGTVTFSSVLAEDHYLTPGVAGFEDGTVNYLSLPAIEYGLDLLDTIGVDVLSTRLRCLTDWLITQLCALRHTNGRPVVRIYGPAHTRQRGATVQMNVFDPSGRMHDCMEIERLANTRRISLRAGCHCNPGARELALGLTRDELQPCFADVSQLSYDTYLRLIAGQTTGAVRASLGLASNFADVQACLGFVATFVDLPVTQTR